MEYKVKNKIKLVIATRENEENFYKTTQSGSSLSLYKSNLIEQNIFFENRKGLPELYNKVIRESENDPAILVFAHDDLLFTDFYWTFRLIEGLNNFDIIGVAGNKRRVANQPSWAFLNTKWEWDNKNNLSGIVGHGQKFPPDNLSFFGPTRQKVKLLDGLLLASHSNTLLKNGIFFDENFEFHFYDLDFCRQAEIKGLSCGTWDLSLIHASGGNFGSGSWIAAYKNYLKKWGD